MNGTSEPVRVPVAHQRDVERARRQARHVALEAGLSRPDAECVVLAVSELATNLLRYATCGAVTISLISGGVAIASVDSGPGIPDLEAAMRDGFSTGGGLGSGLPAARRLLDEFEIESTPQGTRVRGRKWRR